MLPPLNWFAKKFVEYSSLSNCSINTKPTCPEKNKNGYRYSYHWTLNS